MGFIKSVFSVIGKAPKVLVDGLDILNAASEKANAASRTLLIRTNAYAAEEMLRMELELLSMNESSISTCRTRLRDLDIALNELSEIADASELKVINEKRAKWIEEVRRLG